MEQPGTEQINTEQSDTKQLNTEQLITEQTYSVPCFKPPGKIIIPPGVLFKIKVLYRGYLIFSIYTRIVFVYKEVPPPNYEYVNNML